MKKVDKIWTRNFTLATLSGMFSAMVFYIMLTTLAEFSVESYSVNQVAAGLAASIFVLGSVIGRMLCGRYLDAIGRRRVVIFGCVLFFVTSSLYLLSLSLSMLLVLRVIHGLFFGVVHTALSTVVIEFIPAKRRGEGIGLFSLNFVVATALGPFIGLTVVRECSYTVLFIICAASALLSVLLVLPIKYGAAAHEIGAALQDTDAAESTLHSKAKAAKGIFEKKALPLAFTVILMSMCYTGVTAFMSSYAHTKGTGGIAPVFFLVYAACIFVVRPLAGKLLDRRGDNIVMIPTIVCFAASLLLLAFAGSAPVFLASSVLMAFGYGNVLNIGQAVAVKSAPPERVSTATSTYFVFSDAGMGIGPFVLGFVADAHGFSAMYTVEAGIVTIGLVLYMLLHGMRKNKQLTSENPPSRT